MASQIPVSATPTDPYQWHESVLSTRSLSYVSAMADNESPNSPRGSISRTTSRFFGPQTRKNTLTSISDMPDAEVLEMHRARQESITTAIPSLPDAVADSPLFRLPRELREVIYGYILTSPLGFNFPPDNISRYVDPSILRTSRIIYAEAAPVLYSTNKLIFSHPSDANIFRHSIASPLSYKISTLILRVKNIDARLWTSYFNSTTAERSLVKDYPSIRHLYLRFRGHRVQTFFSHEQNALHWLRDAKFQEVIVSVRKCVAVSVKVELCVKTPQDWDTGAWPAAVCRALVEQDRATTVATAAVRELSPKPLRKGEYVSLYGVWVKLETEGT